MQLDLDWNKDFQEFQEVLNCGINPEWLYCAKANMILEPAYTGEGKQFLAPKILLKQVKLYRSLRYNEINNIKKQCKSPVIQAKRNLHCFYFLSNI